jgi:HlyD family secretion protein
MRAGLICVAAVLAVGCHPAGEASWTRVEHGTLTLDTDVSGTLRAVDSDRVGPPGVAGLWNYKIVMMAGEGLVVQAGDPVLMFDTTDLARRLDEKEAERDSAATQLELNLAAARVARHDELLAVAEAKAELRKARLQAEAPEEITAVIELEKARLDVDLAQTKVAYLERKSRSARRRDEAEVARWRRKRDRAEARVHEITEAIGTMTVPSPRTGTVIYQTDWQGNKKKVGDNAWRAETVLQIVALDEMQGRGEIDEVDVSKIVTEQRVALRLDARPDVELRGRVRSISPMVERASPDSPLKVVRIDISLEHDHGSPLRPGMRFRGEVETGRIDDVLFVPLHSVFATSQGPVVHRRNGASIDVVPIVVGQANARYVVVEEGLVEGDEIASTKGTTP